MLTIVYKVYTHYPMTDQKQRKFEPSYSQRLVSHIEAAKQKTYTLADIQRLVKEFGTQEYEARKKTANVFRRGKYQGRTVEDVATFDRNYLEWTFKQSWMDNQKMLKEHIEKALSA